MASAVPLPPHADDVPVLFFDRDVGIKLPQALISVGLPVPVEYHQLYFPQNAVDDLWMPIVGARGWVVLGHDRHHHTRESERAAVRDYGIGCGAVINPVTRRCVASSLPTTRSSKPRSRRRGLLFIVSTKRVICFDWIRAIPGHREQPCPPEIP